MTIARDVDFRQSRDVKYAHGAAAIFPARRNNSSRKAIAASKHVSSTCIAMTKETFSIENERQRQERETERF